MLHQEMSLEVLAGLDTLPDAVIIDGDHNYYTLTEELRVIGELAGDRPVPLLMFHDVGWPHARRDTYYDVDRIPEDRRPPIGRDVGLAPGNPGIDPLGITYPAAALREGGPRNGTLTAIEDFIETRDGLRLVVVPAFFGFGILWPKEIPGADRLAQLLDPYDRNPVLERLERNRVDHLIAGHYKARIEELEDRIRDYERLFQEMLESRAFTVAEHLSRAYQRGEPTFSRARLRRALERQW